MHVSLSELVNGQAICWGQLFFTFLSGHNHKFGLANDKTDEKMESDIE